MNAPSEWAEKRDRFLKECGFSDYQTYLKSSLWEFVRSQLAATESAEQLPAWCGTTAATRRPF